MMVLPSIGQLSTAGPDEILRPVNPWFIVATLFAALAGNLLPLTGVSLALRPDFIALVLLYWCIQEPRYVGVGVAWTIGLMRPPGAPSHNAVTARRPKDPRRAWPRRDPHRSGRAAA